jgi:hypothetical protein
VAHTHADSAKSSDPTGFYASALGTSTVQIERLPVFAIRYSDGVVFGYPLILPAYSAYNSAGTPDEVGVAFTVPYAMRCIGAHFYIAAVGSNASYTVRMYNAANDLLSSWAVGDEDELEGLGYKTVYWSSPQNLAIGATYRLSVLATHASLTVTPGSGTYPDAYAKAAYFQGADFVATSRTDAGAWTDDADATVFISPIVDQITLPSGSASPRWL